MSLHLRSCRWWEIIELVWGADKELLVRSMDRCKKLALYLKRQWNIVRRYWR